MMPRQYKTLEETLEKALHLSKTDPELLFSYLCVRAALQACRELTSQAETKS